ncbi:surface antigen [Plasmodium falciparum UGT5.1]|uniref:Surface antigen n=1 Tax=Plasmodium falciparum UGT5.1 TaxID=1237627 RepID=W7J4K7_PLAFA|nr:surface antigen [Plasmodium falciparum UGT5.1]
MLVYNQRNHKSTKTHTPISRLLCECELYSPTNYDSDPEMKRVMQQFVDRTTQRFHEYDDRMIEKRKQCKEQCDKEIQKIVLKDKIEKQMAQQLTTLETKITTEDIPTCICEKSMADKTEKFCLNCSKNMGAIAPWWGLVCGTGYAGWSHYVPFAISKAATDAGMKVVIHILKGLRVEKLIPKIYEKISSTGNYANITEFSSHIYMELKAVCTAMSSSPGVNEATSTQICSIVKNGPTGGSTVADVVSGAFKLIVEKAPKTAKAAKKIEAAKYTSTTSSLTTGITASIIAIVIIVLIMVIIYLILHYRRKKKMKKKLQYIKLLEE